MLTIHTIHHVPAARRGVILGTSDDPVDPSLLPAFKKQTRGLVDIVCDLVAKSGTSAAVYTSSIQRQRQTAEALFGATPIPIVIEERLRQIDNGPTYTGMEFDVGKEAYLDHVDTPFPGGESFADFARRVRDFLDETAARHDDHTVITVGWRLSPAIFAHVCGGVPLRTAIADNADIRGPFTYPGR